MHFAPVCDAARPVASTKPSWREAACGSAAVSCAIASAGATPLFSSARPFGPYDGSANAWVAIAPTPGSAHVTRLPTENQCDCTATPRSPVTGSRATIENVFVGRTLEPPIVPSGEGASAKWLSPLQ